MPLTSHMLLLRQVLRVMPALTELRLPQCPRITGAAIEQLPSLVPELRLGMLPPPAPPCSQVPPNGSWRLITLGMSALCMSASVSSRCSRLRCVLSCAVRTMPIRHVLSAGCPLTWVQGAGLGRVPGSQRRRPAHRVDGPEAAALHLLERHPGGVGHAPRGDRTGLAAHRGKAPSISW